MSNSIYSPTVIARAKRDRITELQAYRLLKAEQQKHSQTIKYYRNRFGNERVY